MNTREQQLPQSTLTFFKRHKVGAGVLAFAAVGLSTNLYADQLISDDLIVQSSACVGTDCVNGESFSFDTVRLKENNLRIKFQDTSGSASFPTRDWQLTANDSSNGGQNRFSIDDIDGGKTPLTVEANAPNHSLYLDDGGSVGFGTSTPVVEMHSVDGDSPTLRLEQNGSSGFTPQTWDVAGNETNFFIRDATNGSKLPFRIEAGAPNASLYTASDGDIGLGTTTPDGLLDIAHPADANNHAVLVSPTGNFGINVDNGFSPQALFDVQSSGGESNFAVTAAGNVGIGTAEPGSLLEVKSDSAVPLAVLADEVSIEGNLNVTGTISSGGQELNVPDYVFEDDYALMSLDELSSYIAKEKHLPKVPSAKDIQRDGLEHAKFQMRLLEKVEELTLYTLDQHRTIGTLEAQNRALQERLQKLEQVVSQKATKR